MPLFYHYLNGHAVYEFPGDFIMTGHVHILPYTSWAPKVHTCHCCFHARQKLDFPCHVLLTEP